MNESELSYECCFCGKGIEPSYTDPCAINVMINFDKSKDKQHNQEFFGHLDCFKKQIKPTVPVYLEYLLD